MKLKKNIIISIAVLILLASAFLIVFERNNNMQPEKALNNFSKLIVQGKIGDISLTIYYRNLGVFTLMPTSVDTLINTDNETIICIDVSNLKEYADLFQQISSDVLIPVEHGSRIDARLYYVFKN